MSAKLNLARQVAADWEAAGAYAPSEASRETMRERFAALDGPDAEQAAFDLGNGIPSVLGHVVGWTETALIKAANDRRNAEMAERHRLDALKRARLATEMSEMRESADLTLGEMDAVLFGRQLANITVKLGFSKNIEMKGGHYSVRVLEAAHEAYRGIALLRGANVASAGAVRSGKAES